MNRDLISLAYKNMLTTEEIVELIKQRNKLLEFVKDVSSGSMCGCPDCCGGPAIRCSENAAEFLREIGEEVIE